MRSFNPNPAAEALHQTRLRRLTKETCDETAGLAMSGAMDSLNVSAAAAVALYELTRQT